MNKNKQWLANTNYNINDEFNLKIGHKSAILNLALRTEAYLNSKKEAKEKKKKIKLSVIVDENALKVSLQEKLTKYMKKLNCNTQFSSRDFIEFRQEREGEHDILRCKVKCKYCDKSIPATFKNYWFVSIIEAHLKKHVKEASNLSKKSSDPKSKN